MTTRTIAPFFALIAVIATAPTVYSQPLSPGLSAVPVALVQARELIDDERYHDAYGKLHKLLAGLTAGEPTYNAAQYDLARCLLALRLHYAALLTLDAVQVPDNHPLYAKKVHGFLQIQRALPGDLATIERLSMAPEAVFRGEDLAEVRFLLGRFHFEASEHKRALERLGRILPANGEHYLKARYLMGVVYVVLNRAQPALDAFKDVLRFQSQVGDKPYYDRYRQMAYMALGRLFFSIGKHETAGRYYDRVRHGTDSWLDSLGEIGWTYFHLRRFDRVLGHLQTLNSPYFEDRYYPEARVLKALILFRTCRFNETLVVVQRFLRDYKPLRKELDAQLTNAHSDAEFYGYLASLSADKESLSLQLRRIFHAALNDRTLQRTFGLVSLLGEEVKGLKRLKRNTEAQQQAQGLLNDLGRVRNVLISEAGAMARRRLSRVREELTEIIRQGLRIKYETLKARRNSISESVRIAMAETAAVVSEPRQPDDEHVVWPFDGTYWRDELGGYNYDIRSLCQPKHFPRGWKKAAKRRLPERPSPAAKKAAPVESAPEQTKKKEPTTSGQAAGR